MCMSHRYKDLHCVVWWCVFSVDCIWRCVFSCDMQLGDLLSGREAFTAAENKAEDVNSDLLRKLQAMHK